MRRMREKSSVMSDKVSSILARAESTTSSPVASFSEALLHGLKVVGCKAKQNHCSTRKLQDLLQVCFNFHHQIF